MNFLFKYVNNQNAQLDSCCFVLCLRRNYELTIWVFPELLSGYYFYQHLLLTADYFSHSRSLAYTPYDLRTCRKIEFHSLYFML